MSGKKKSIKKREKIGEKNQTKSGSVFPTAYKKK